MNLKQFAKRGLIVLALAVALCMFFSKTVVNITTAKVKLVAGRQGKLEQAVKLSGKIAFPEAVDVRLDNAQAHPVLVGTVFVRPGYQVQAGDKLFAGSLSGYEEARQKLLNDYEAKQAAFLDLETRNRKLKKTSARNELYEKTLSTQRAYLQAEATCLALARAEGIALPGYEALAARNAGLLAADEHAQPLAAEALARAAGASQALIAAAREMAAAGAARDAAEALYFDSFKKSGYGVNESVYKYVMERNKALRELEELARQLTALETDRALLEIVRAQADGYIVEVGVKAGEAYDGKKAAYRLSTGPAALRAVLPDDFTAAIKGAEAAVKLSDSTSLKTKVTAIGIDEAGKRYAQIELTEEMIRQKGSLLAFMSAELPVTITLRAGQSSTLLPASAVRGEGEESYVYAVEQRWGALENGRLAVRKTPVTVLGRSEQYVSIVEDLMGMQIADKEDRPIEDGSPVMEYMS